MDIDTAFEILGLDKYEVTMEDVTKQYKTLLRKYHPDKNKNSNATAKTQEIINAYDIIKGIKHLLPYERPAPRYNTPAAAAAPRYTPAAAPRYTPAAAPPAANAYASPRYTPPPPAAAPRPPAADKNYPTFTAPPVYPEFKPSSRYVPPKRKTNLFEKPNASYTKRSQPNDAYGPSPAARAYLEKYGNYGLGLKPKSSRKKNTKKRKQTKKRKGKK
jgi:curved DNA-binding protein CbpA